MERLEVLPVDGIPEVRPGADLAELLLTAEPDVRSGDVVVVSSKAVAKAAGLAVRAERDSVVEQHTSRVVAQRGALRVVRLRTGLTMAAAGVDASNTAPGTVVPLPPDPDASARSLRRRVSQLAGVDVAVVVTDTAGRPWREGQTDLAVGVAGLVPLLDLAGTPDAGGALLQVTAPAIADEVAGAAELVRGKALRRPFALVRGLATLIRADDGPGARALVRDEATDLFGLGSVDAVRHAVRRDDDTANRGFPAPGAVADWLRGLVDDAAYGVDRSLARVEASPADLVVVLARPDSDAALLAAGALVERVRVLAAAHRAGTEDGSPAGEGAVARAPAGWRVVTVVRLVPPR